MGSVLPHPLSRSVRRRGVASLLAMLYLVLFAMLAVGFYAMASISMRVTYSERSVVDAQLAAETGVDFMRHVLYQVVVPHRTPPDEILAEVNKDLRALLNNTGNLYPNTVELTDCGNRIDVPLGSGNYIKIANGAKFRAEIKRNGTNLVVKVTGAGDGAASAGNRRRIELDFARKERPTNFFRIGMASAGPVNVLTKNIVQGFPADHAQILTLATTNPPITIGTSSGSSYGGVAGDLYVPQGAPAPLVYPNWSVAGTTNQMDITANHVHYMTADEMPPLPVPVTSLYKSFVTDPYVPDLASYKNIIIPPNTNPLISGPTEIKGVVYIQQPNRVTFAGNCAITGVIVGEDMGVGTLLTNQIIFSGNGGAKNGVESLPDTPEFSALKRLAGSFIVAPGFDVQLTGNFGSINGHIAGDKVTLSGATNSNVTGTLVALKSTLTIGGNTSATLLYDPNQGHAGLRVEDRYVPVMSTYEEVQD